MMNPQLPLVAQAQAPTPTPAPSPVRTLSDNIAALSQRAGSLLPYLDNENRFETAWLV